MEPYKGRKRLPHKRHLWRLEETPLETCKSENISLDQRREGVILLVIDPRQLVSGKQRTFQSEPISGSPDAELPAHEAESRICTILRRIYPKAGLKAKLNSTIMAMIIPHTPPKQFKVFRSLGYCRLSKTLKGVLLTLKKDKILIGPNNV